MAASDIATRARGAEVAAAALVRLGVRHVFGVGGANIEDMFLAVQRRRPEIMAVLDKHEHSAGTAADAYARITRSLGVVLTTSGGGAMNLVSALAESLASRVPVLAIVGEPATSLQGRGAFQDTSGRGAVDAQSVFRGVSVSCERCNDARDLAALVEVSGWKALEQGGPAVLLVAKDLQQAQVEHRITTEPAEPRPQSRLEPDPPLIVEAADVLTDRPVVIVAGDEVARAGAQQDLARLANVLDARVAVTPDGRDAFDNDDVRFVGVTGAMGHDRARETLVSARVCVLAGTRMPLLARLGHEAVLEARARLSIGRDLPFVSSPRAVHIGGDLVRNVRALAAELERRRPGPSEETTPLSIVTASTRALVESDRLPYGSASILRAVTPTLPEGSVVLVDAGNTGAHAVHHVHAPRDGRWLIAMGMAGMGYTFGGAIGAAFATGKRTLVVAGDGAFFMHGLEIHTAIEHQLPITYVIVNNQAHGMCLLRERLLLREESGCNVFRKSNIGAGLAAMFPGLASSDCRTLSEVERAVARAALVPGPSVVCACLPDVDVPPFAAFRP